MLGLRNISCRITFPDRTVASTVQGTSSTGDMAEATIRVSKRTSYAVQWRSTSPISAWCEVYIVKSAGTTNFTQRVAGYEMDMRKPETQNKSTMDNGRNLYNDPPLPTGHMGSVYLEIRRVNHQMATTQKGKKLYFVASDDPSTGMPPYAKFLFHFELDDASSEGQRKGHRAENTTSATDPVALATSGGQHVSQTKSNTNVAAGSTSERPRGEDIRATSGSQGPANSEAGPATPHLSDSSDPKRRGSDAEIRPGILPLEQHREKRRRVERGSSSPMAMSDSENEEISLDIEILAQSNARIEAEICAERTRLSTLKEQAKYLENKIIFFRLNEDIRKTCGSLSQQSEDEDDLSWDETGDAQFFIQKNVQMMIAINGARERLLIAREKAKYNENRATLTKLRAELLATQTLCEQLKSNIASISATSSPQISNIETVESKPAVSGN